MVKIKDKYKIEKRYVSNKLARSGQKINEVRYFVAHETANPTATADNHFTYFQNIKFQASAHTFIDDIKILEIIPLDEKAWHVQYNQDKRTLGLGYANDYAIGPELCRTGDFKKGYDKYVWYFAYLCKTFNKKPKQHITAHSFEDPQRRSDPQSWLSPNGVSWSQFLNDVQNYFDNWNKDDGESKPSTSAPKPQPSTSIVGAKLIKNENAFFLATENIKVRSQPTTNATHTGTLPKGASINYKRVFEGNGYRWLEYTGNSGNTLYLPYRATSGTINNWGTFHSERPQTKSIDEVAREILYSRNYGGWGTGETRRRKLRDAGYDPAAVQRRINQLA